MIPHTMVVAMETAIARRWKQGERAIATQTIYDDLIAQGIEVPNGVMDRILQGWLRGGDIQGAQPIGREAIQKHGSIVITWIAPDFGE